MSEGERQTPTDHPKCQPKEVAQVHDESKIQTIKSLLAKANNAAASDAEQEAYLDKAYQLMAKYGIEMALLNEEQPGSDAVISKKITTHGKWLAHQSRLYGELAAALRCEIVKLGEESDRSQHTLDVVGFQSDVDRLELLFASLSMQMFSGVMRARVPAGENTASFRHAWMLGFVVSVSRRVTEAERRAQGEAAPVAGGRSMALVLADRSALVKSAFREKYPRTRKGSGSRARGSGFGHGSAAGERADIGTGSVQGRGRRALT